MDTWVVVVMTAVVCVLIAAAAWILVEKTRSRRLKQRFGPEYERTVDRYRDRQLAEAELQNRKQRVERYTIVELSPQDRSKYLESWQELQRRFVDHPAQAVEEGDRLVLEVMQKRGYPLRGFEEAAADLSVDYPAVVTHYRAAGAVAARNRTGEAGTEELRQALVHYRELFHELLESRTPAPERKDSAPSNRSGRKFSFPSFQNRRRGGLRS